MISQKMRDRLPVVNPNREGLVHPEILVVEDNEAQAEQLRMVLSKNGYGVSTAMNGKEALTYLEERQPAAVISDILMPEMDGYDLCRRIKDRFGEVPVILLTALSDPHDVIKGLQCGADGFITKPYDVDFLLARIKYTLVNHEIRRASPAMGMEIFFSGKKYVLNSERMQILDLLLSTYDNAVQKNDELEKTNQALFRTHQELEILNARLEERVKERTRELRKQIAERERTEAELKKANLLKERVMDNAKTAIFLLDGDRRFSFANLACTRILGYPIKGLLGNPLTFLVDRESLPKLKDQFEYKEVSKSGLAEKEIEIIKGDGTKAIISLQLSPLAEGNGALILVGIAEDITERKKLEALEIALQSSRRVMKMKSEFLANVTHEFVTPLNAILGFSQVLLDQHFGVLNEKQREYTQDILDSGTRLLNLINNILELSSAEEGNLEMEVSQVSLRAVVENTLDILREKAIRKGIALSCHVGLIPERIAADERKLKQVLHSLVANAIKFTPNGGEITVSCDVEDKILLQETQDPNTAVKRLVQVSVRDTGIGIREDSLMAIFDSLKQMDSSIHKRFEGVGAGLALTKHFVELHGGRIWAESEGSGKGSTFYFTIPY
jgi:PAS domain S-box-containing protein